MTAAVRNIGGLFRLHYSMTVAVEFCTGTVTVTISKNFCGYSFCMIFFCLVERVDSSLTGRSFFYGTGRERGKCLRVRGGNGKNCGDGNGACMDGRGWE